MPELRQDIVSGDWVVIAGERASRPHFLDQKKKARKPSPKSTCPFENLEKSGNWPPLFTYPSLKNWKIALIPNKYPALVKSNVCSVPFEHGVYHGRTAVGNHQLLITRDHDKNIATLDKGVVEKLFEAFQAVHIMAGKDKCAVYVSSFLNWGPGAGASIWHPHYQILTLPVVPPHVRATLRGGSEYMRRNGKCARCEMLKAERKDKTRIIEENKYAVLLAPYASRHAFEMMIIPKAHASHFGKASPALLAGMAALTQSGARRLKKYLNDPDFNFYIHDAPVDRRDYSYHHWHAEILPVNVVAPPGGFEASTVININVIDPNFAAAVLRGDKKLTQA